MTTCILLAGGAGSRLRGALPGVPKCLAPVRGASFLELQLARLSAEGIGRFLLSLGHLAQQVVDAARVLRRSYELEWVVEPAPLGTGGAALFAMQRAGLREALVANADTFLDAPLGALLAPLDRAGGEQARMGVAAAPGGARFGAVVVEGARVRRFLPAGAEGAVLVNAGIYRIGRDAFAPRHAGQPFSLESEVLQALAVRGGLGATVLHGAFADIGVPRDYRRFCEQHAERR